MIRKDAVCDECGKIEEINHNYGLPNDWFGVNIKINDSDRKDLHFCAKICFIEYIKRYGKK